MARPLSRRPLSRRPLSRRFAGTAALSATLSAVLALAAGTAAAQPNLVPLLSNPMNASVGVQNTGDSAAGPSHLTINCTEFGQADGGCPDTPGLAAYADPAYPNRAVVAVPALQPGESFNHDLAFWAAIPWTPGTYVFDAVADAGNAVAESNEANNTTQSSYTEQADAGVAPPQPLPLAARPLPAKPLPPKLSSSNIFVPKPARTATVRPQQPAAPQRLAPAEPSEPKRLLLRAPTRPVR
jgi:hypothetical protein